jgi:hypothetical protein
MTAESFMGLGCEEGNIEKKSHKSLFFYPPFDGHEGSSRSNWVPADFLIYCLAKLIHATDEDLKQKRPR